MSNCDYLYLLCNIQWMARNYLERGNAGMHPNLARIMLEHTVSRKVAEIKANPQKGIQGLVELLLSLIQSIPKTVKDMVASALRDEGNPYYQMLIRLIMQTDLSYLQKFGISLGYNSLTLGVKTIREYAAKYGYVFPWMLLIEFGVDVDGGNDWDAYAYLQAGDIHNIVEQGKVLGIYTYALLVRTWDDLLVDVFQKHQDCAFILILPYGSMQREIIMALRQQYNIMLALESRLDQDRQDWSTNQEHLSFNNVLPLLRQYGMLYACYTLYHDRVVEPILTDQWVTDINHWQSVFAFLLTAGECSTECAVNVQDYVHHYLWQPRYPVLQTDLYECLRVINQWIFGEGSWWGVLGVQADGTLLVGKQSQDAVDGCTRHYVDYLVYPDYNVRQMPLIEVLKRGICGSQHRGQTP